LKIYDWRLVIYDFKRPQIEHGIGAKRKENWRGFALSWRSRPGGGFKQRPGLPSTGGGTPAQLAGADGCGEHLNF
jgi:hypothetical protein